VIIPTINLVLSYERLSAQANNTNLAITSS
jgi:hypothetical protein